MIRATLHDMPHACASGETPCSCDLHAWLLESGDLVPFHGERDAQAALERGVRRARQREGRFLLMCEWMREDLLERP